MSESRNTDSLEYEILALPAGRRLALVEFLVRSLRRDQLTADQNRSNRVERKQAIDRLLAKMETLPVNNPDDGFSGDDHDQILYGSAT